MDPFSIALTSAYLGSLASILSGNLLSEAGRGIKRAVRGEEIEQAFDRCIRTGIVAVVQTTIAQEPERTDLLRDILDRFFREPDVGGELAEILNNRSPNQKELTRLFQKSGYDPDTLPGIRFDEAVNAFAAAFLAAAVMEPLLQSVIHTNQILEQTQLQRDLLETMKQMAVFMRTERYERLTVHPNMIQAENADKDPPRRFILEHGAQPIENRKVHADHSQIGVIGDNNQIHGGIHYHGNFRKDDGSVDVKKLRDAYLNRLLCDAGVLNLEGIDPDSAACKTDSKLSLGAVYTALLTQGSDDRPEQMETVRSTEQPRASALEILDKHRHLVLLGDPGSGKTTFVNFVTWCMAGELYGHSEANLHLLTQALPDEKGKDQDEPQQWSHGPLLPVRVVLRDFAARGLPEKNASVADLWRFLENEMENADLKEYAPFLRKELLEEGGLLLLDGLDEVPEAENRRVRIKAVVEDFIKTFHKCRVLVTSRTYAYQKQDWRILQLHETVLARFSDGQIRRFVDRWYANIASVRYSDSDDARGRAELLKRAIFDNPRLRELAERPLLLTLMAGLHSWRGGSLPEKREELYSDTVDLLLDWWERPKTVKDSDGNMKLIQPSLLDWLKIDRLKMRRMLNELAYRVHSDQPELTGTADISEDELVKGLWGVSNNPEVNPVRLLEHLGNRAGLLLPRGVKVHTFPHRTFQEYLSACHLTDSDYPDGLAELCRTDAERWREVCLLAGAKAARGSSSSIWSLAEALCYREVNDSKAGREDLWGAQLAGQALGETAILEQVSPRNQTKLVRIRNWLVKILEGHDLPATERAIAGNSLAVLGDPRAEVMTIEGMRFCRVPAGSFKMGDKGETTKIDYDFWIGRYPVTNAQYQAFVDAGGYGIARYWKEAAEEGLWKSGKFKDTFFEAALDRAYDFGNPFNLPNHPVVGVSWYEALAFCRWLTDQCAGEHTIRLPHETEWEMAARGGIDIPVEPVLSRLEDLPENKPMEMEPNRKPDRKYPWGENADPDKANYADAKIGATNSVGAFRDGKSSYGALEMSGNVWEWCLDRYSEKGASRVLRGGSWVDDAGYCRAACRCRVHPGYRYHGYGFRLALRPGRQAGRQGAQGDGGRGR